MAQSTSTLTIQTGPASFEVASGLAYLPGFRIRALANGNPSYFMEGYVTGYIGTTLSVNVDLIENSGEYSNWNIGVSGIPGANGAQGEQGLPGAQGPQGEVGPQGPDGAGY